MCYRCLNSEINAYLTQVLWLFWLRFILVSQVFLVWLVSELTWSDVMLCGYLSLSYEWFGSDLSQYNILTLSCLSHILWKTTGSCTLVQVVFHISLQWKINNLLLCEDLSKDPLKGKNTVQSDSSISHLFLLWLVSDLT